MLEIIPVRTEKQLDAFIKLPWSIYYGDKNWVPPLLREEKKLLDRKIHPFHRHAEVEYFLAQEDGKLKGRIAAIVNHLHNEFHNERTGFFGFFECVNDAAVAKALFDRAEAWLREKGMTVSRGPCNFSTNETCGLLVEGFDSPPVFMMTYNLPYYADLLHSHGYEKAMDLYAWLVIPTKATMEKFARFSQLIQKRNDVTIRSMNLRHFRKELDTVKAIYNNAWSKNWGFVPMTDEEFEFGAKDMKTILLPEFAYIAEIPACRDARGAGRQGKPVGFALALPDINRVLKRLNGRLFPFGWLYLLLAKRKIPFIRIITLGVVREVQHTGIGSLFYMRFFEETLKRNIEKVECSWILETNELMNKPIREFGSKLYKRYRLYEKKLT